MSNKFKLRERKVYDKVTGKRVGTIVGVDGLNDLHPDDFWVRVLFDYASYVIEEKIASVQFFKKYTTEKPEDAALWNSEYDVQEPKSKTEKRGRLDILQDLTEQGAEWKLETDLEQPLFGHGNMDITWFTATFDGKNKTCNTIRQAIDWIIEQVGEKGQQE